MQLQFFAEGDPNGGSGALNGGEADLTQPAGSDSQNNEGDSSSKETNADDEADTTKVIEKLQSRIGKEQGKKNELQQQLEQAQAELKKLKSGDDGKPAKESKKTPEQIKVEELERQLARRDIIDQTLDVFKESQIDVPKDVVSMIVSDDRDKTVENATELLGFITSIKKDTEAKVRAEYAGGKVPSATKHQDSSSNFGVEVAKLGGTRAPLQNSYSN